MANEYDAIIHARSRRPQVLTIREQGENSSMISEDEKITLRLLPARQTDGELTDVIEQSCRPLDSTLRFYDDDDQRGKIQLDGPVSEIDLDTLCAADEILFETAHSAYNFTVTDPAIPAGRLIGGILGNRLVNAALVPSRVESRSRLAHKSLKSGAKFIFLIENGSGFKRLTTSRVKSLIHRKNGSERNVIARSRCVSREHVSSDKSDR